MGRAGWKNVLCWMLLVLFVLSVILYVKNQGKNASMTDATLVRICEERLRPSSEPGERTFLPEITAENVQTEPSAEAVSAGRMAAG